MSAIDTAQTGSPLGLSNPADPANPHVLLVDDQPARLLTYESILQGVGVQCVRALSGREALERLLRQPFALIVMDVSMPEMDGFETARMIREHPKFEHTPIIFVTGVYLTDLDTLRGYEAGAIDYIQVPLVPEILRSKVALLTELYRRRAQLERLNAELEEARARLVREHEQRAETAALKAREHRASALLRLADRFRSLTAPAELAYAAAEILGETLGVSRCGYGTINLDAETITIERDWNAPGITTIAGTLHFRDYGSYIEELKVGMTVVCEDTETDSRTQATVAALAAISVRAFVNMPVTEQAGTVALLYLNHIEARPWTLDELSLIQEFAERTRIAVERKRSERMAAADLRDTSLLRDLAVRVIVGDGRAVVEDILSAAMSITEADCGTVQMLEEGTQTLVFMATRNAPSELMTHFARVDATSNSPCGLALARGDRVFVHFDVSEVQDPDGSLRLHLRHGFHSGQSTPLITRDGRPLGMFSTHWRRKRLLTERETRFLDLLARQAADVIERVRYEESLRASERQLREADRRKDEFIAMLAHELRNPLVPIRTGIELLKKVHRQPDLAETLRPMMERQVQHMVHLIDDLLDVSRITSGTIKLQRQRLSISAALAPALDATRDAIAAGGFDFSVSLSDPHYVIEVDPTRFAQVLANLLQNAVKFTPAAGKISLTCEITRAVSGEPVLAVTVQDSGLGIASSMLPGIFELFQHRLCGYRTTQQGLGIGLALSRKLTEMHGGTLLVRSEGEGRGSSFTVTVPAPPGLQLHEQSDNTASGILHGARILVVDDNRDAADSMAMLIDAMGAETRVAYNGESGLAATDEFSPHVILLDIGMPDLSGYEVCQKIRSTRGPELAVVAVSGWGQAHDKQLAAAAGFNAHLTKPADPSALQQILLRLAPSRRQTP